MLLVGYTAATTMPLYLSVWPGSIQTMIYTDIYGPGPVCVLDGIFANITPIGASALYRQTMAAWSIYLTTADLTAGRFTDRRSQAVDGREQPRTSGS